MDSGSMMDYNRELSRTYSMKYMNNRGKLYSKSRYKL